MSISPMAEALRPLASRMPQVVREREVLLVAATLGGANVAQAVEQSLAGRVMQSARASRELRSAAFQDPQTAARCLLWLANDYRERRLNGGDGNLHDQPIAEGIRNERCGADAFQIDWQGRREDVDWHIKNGGNTRSPSRCLRIYYFWDDATHQVVIASMPAHITSGAS